MRVLIANANQSVVGGVETHLRTLLPLLQARGHQLGLVFASSHDPARPTIDGGCLGIRTQSVPVENPAEVGAAAVDWRPDVVYSHGLHDPAAEAALAEQFPVVYFAHNYAGTCISGTKCHSLPGSQPCSRRLSPACLGYYYVRRCGGLSPATALTLYHINRRRQSQLGDYRAVLAASRHMACELIRNGLSPERTHLVPLFPSETPDQIPPPPKPRTDRILFVGRLTALKGWRPLIAAIPLASAELGRTLTLVVAGDGPDRSAFEAESRRQGVPAEFLGWVNPERRTTEMRSADLLVVPSLWPEPFGLVGIEAGCVGLPAVAFAVGGIPDWLIPGVSGELAPGERPRTRELAAAIVRALKDDAHRHKLGLGAWETSRKFTPEAHLDKLIPILEAAAQ